MMKCPLCCSSKLQIREKIAASHLIDLYRKRAGLNIEHLIGSGVTIKYLRCESCDLRFFLPAITGNESFYNGLQVHPWYYAETKAEYSYAAAHIGKNRTVLDVGCGKGAFASTVNPECYTGLDFSREAAELARRNGVRVLNQTVEEHAQFNQEKYDCVVSFQVLEHVADVRSFLQSALRCLKPRGKLIIGVPSLDSFLAHAENSVLNLPPHHVSHWSDHALKSVARVFDLVDPVIWHEELNFRHTGWYNRTVANHRSLSRFGISTKQVVGTLTGKILRRLLGVLQPFGELGDQITSMPNGHTVVAIYEKKSAR